MVLFDVSLLLSVMMEESKLTNFQRGQITKSLTGGKHENQLLPYRKRGTSSLSIREALSDRYVLLCGPN